jgi:hypothetical protein
MSSPWIAAEGRYENSQIANNSHESAPITFLRAAAYTGLQSPVNGFVQLVKPDILPSVQFVDAPSDSRSLAAMAGSGAATLGHAYLMMAAGNKIAGAAPPGDLLGLGKRALATGALGGLYGFALTPVGNDERQNFWVSRAENALAGTAGMALISAHHTMYHGWLSGGMAAKLGQPRPEGHLLMRSLGVAAMGGWGLIGDKLSSTNDDWGGGSVFTPSGRLRPAQQLKLHH